MGEVDTNSDIESESDLSLDLEIDSDGAIRPFMFETQHGTSGTRRSRSRRLEQSTRNGRI